MRINISASLGLCENATNSTDTDQTMEALAK